ncbi:MAG: hypothetical protein WA064_02415 [Candidatus Moraniibacteriota bacterium]
MDSFYQIIGNKIFFSDRRLDQYRKPIIDLFQKIDCVYNSDLPREVVKNIIKKKKDCEHKITAVRYALALIQDEMAQKISAREVREYSEMVRNGICDEAELKNEVLIYETEAFLFQVKSSLDVLVQLLKNMPNYEKTLSLKGTIDRESFDMHDSLTKKSTCKKIKEAGDNTLADYLGSEIKNWIQELNIMRNEITHRSALEGFTCFIYASNTESLIEPKMPNGKEVDKYCESIYNKLLELFDKVITDFIVPKL